MKTLSAVGWIAENLPVYSINFVLATAEGLWALAALRMQ